MDIEQKRKYIKAFSLLPIGNISDAMDILGMKRGVIFGLSPLYTGEKTAVGFAFTIKQGLRKTVFDGTSLAKQGTIIDTEVSEADMIVIDTGGITEVSTGGGIQILRAKMLGASGYLTNGALRDLDEIRNIGLPTFIKSACPVRSAEVLETIGSGISLDFNGVMINPGDLIAMDDTGIIVVPIEKIDEVLIKAQKINQKEEKMIDFIKNGGTLTEARKLKFD